MKKQMRIRYCLALALAAVALTGTAWAETIEFVTYFPASRGAAATGDHHDRLTVGPGYFGESPLDGGVLIEGSVGIGTTMPEHLLHIVGSAAPGAPAFEHPRVMIENTLAGSAALQLEHLPQGAGSPADRQTATIGFSEGSDPLRINNNGNLTSAHLLIHPNGDIGIGFEDAPLSLVHLVKGPGQFSSMLTFESGNPEPPFVEWLHNPAGGVGVPYGQLQAGNFGTTKEFRFTAKNNANFHFQNGRVGVGTGVPSHLFQVQYTADEITGVAAVVVADSSTDAMSSNANHLVIANQNQTNGNFAVLGFSDGPVDPWAAAVGAKITNHANNYGELHLGTRGAAGFATRAVVDAQGNAGIGTQAPRQTSPTNNVSTGNLTVNDIFLLSTNAWASELGGGGSQIVGGYVDYRVNPNSGGPHSYVIDVNTQNWTWSRVSSQSSVSITFATTTYNRPPLTLGTVVPLTGTYILRSGNQNYSTNCYVSPLSPTIFRVAIFGSLSGIFYFLVYGS